MVDISHRTVPPSPGLRLTRGVSYGAVAGAIAGIGSWGVVVVFLTLQAITPNLLGVFWGAIILFIVGSPFAGFLGSMVGTPLGTILALVDQQKQAIYVAPGIGVIVIIILLFVALADGGNTFAAVVVRGAIPALGIIGVFVYSGWYFEDRVDERVIPPKKDTLTVASLPKNISQGNDTGYRVEWNGPIAEFSDFNDGQLSIIEEAIHDDLMFGTGVSGASASHEEQRNFKITAVIDGPTPEIALTEATKTLNQAFLSVGKELDINGESWHLHILHSASIREPTANDFRPIQPPEPSQAEETEQAHPNIWKAGWETMSTSIGQSRPSYLFGLILAVASVPGTLLFLIL